MTISTRGKHHIWTQNEKELLRLYYDHTMRSQKILAERISIQSGNKISFYQVRNQLCRMGLLKSSHIKVWTEEENERLINLMGHYCPDTVSRRMHHSVNSVVVQYQRLTYSRRDHVGWYNLQETCKILGKDDGNVRRYITEGKLKASRHYLNGGQNHSWHIEESDLKEFIIKYSGELAGHRVDLPVIVQILTAKKDV